MRSSKPSELSIGGIFTASHEIFAELYQCSQLTLDSQSTYSILQKLLAAFGIVCSYNLIRDLVSYIEYDYENFLDENEIKISEKYMKMTRLYIIFYVGSAILYGILTIIPTIFSIFLYKYRSLDSVNIPYMFPVNTNYSGFLRYGLLLCQIIALFTILTMDLSFCRFKIRQQFTEEKFIHINTDNQTNEEESVWIINIIRRYIRVTKCQVPIYTLAKKNQKLLLLITMRSSKPSELSIGGLFSSSNEVFAGIMQLSTILQNTRDTVECFICIVGSIVTIFIIFYMGQTLINHSIAVCDELRQTPFYVLSIKTQKLLQFLIARSIKPCELSIGGLFVASHETFSVILQKALSFATILQLSDILQNTSKTFECSVVIVGSIMTVYINFYIGQVVIDYSRAALEEL
ncbi:PREDICTED: putative odorant receptor 92a [Polistes canadensis]|uniref:putative odorant receptor 92a n=1 Tax=Polistes canadensis TaxID=91411 RepID=UPI000718B5AD|nr:PREDICTED: putative odorant receptor 92a [Polistes canadensis]